MLIPAKVKFRRQHRGRMKGNAKGGDSLAMGAYGMQALGRCWMTGNQLEAARKVITRSVKRGGKMWIRVFPQKPVSKKPLETRMGKGKPAPDHWVAVIKPGRIIFELDGVNEADAKAAIEMAGFKLPIKTRFVSVTTESKV